jgi:predicted NUDIX family NTP pyrophosphohydrolase
MSPATGRTSAGILLYRRTPGPAGSEGAAHGIEVLLAHMGGPYFARKDEGAWSIPKGEYDASEEPWDAARREFAEEIGQPPPQGPPIDLGSVTQRNGKVVTAYALEGDLDPESMRSNTFELEWPPRSGRIQTFPEMDRAGWFTPEVARAKALSSQGELIDRLEARLDT